MTTPFDQLPRFSWRGSEYPLTGRSASFAHETVQHKLQRRNNDLVEQIGAHNLVITYTLPMREGVFKGPYRSLFLQGLPKLYRDVRDKSEGDLVDPIFGPLRAVPTSYNDDIDVQRRDGTDVRIELLTVPGEDLTPEFPTIQSLFDDGRSLDAVIQAVEEAPANPAERAAIQEFRQIESGGPSTDLLSAINGVGQQVIGLGNRVNNAIDREIFRVEKLEETARELATPNGWILRERARLRRDTLIRAKSDAARNATTRNYRNTTTRSLASIAAELGISVEALVAANPGLARRPTVSAGAIIRVPL